MGSGPGGASLDLVFRCMWCFDAFGAPLSSVLRSFRLFAAVGAFGVSMNSIQCIRYPARFGASRSSVLRLFRRYTSSQNNFDDVLP